MTSHVGIVAHLDRLMFAEQLADRVQAEYVAFDDGTLGCEGNHRRLWQWHSDQTDQDWSVVLEDDAQPVTTRATFRATLDTALDAAPAPIVSLYLGRSRPPHWQRRIAQAIDQAAKQDACWIRTDRLLHAVGVAVRTDLIDDMLGHLAGTVLPIDQAIGHWARQRGHRVAYTVPSLVDHRDLPTLVDHRDGAPRSEPRRAWSAGDRSSWVPSAVVSM